MYTEGDPKSDSEMIENHAFQEAWKNMDPTDNIDVVVILSHSSNDSFTAYTNTETEEKQKMYRTDIEELATRNIDRAEKYISLFLSSCAVKSCFRAIGIR